MMRVLYILPGIGKKPGERYLRSWLMEPLTIAVLKNLTPPEFATEFFDDRVELIDYDLECDIVAITLEAYTAQRAYVIADRFRARGRIVICGGYHATLCPDDVAAHADIVVTGNAESVWAQVLQDISRGLKDNQDHFSDETLGKNHITAGGDLPRSYQARYDGKTLLDYGLPDRSIYADNMNKYLPISLVEVGRGCHRTCEFCSISTYYCGCYQHRRIEDIIAEIKQCRHRLFFFVDDSIFSNRAFARELFLEVAKLKITWTTQITLDIARDEELLVLMRQSGCELVLIGFESINAGNLKQMNKAWSQRLGERDEIVERIHRAGISIYASFVFGFDEDSQQTFDEVLEFSLRHQFFAVAFNHLLAFPGTKTYQRFAEEGRLLSSRWWLEDGYTYGTISFTPALITPTELRGLCSENKRRFYTFRSILKRAPVLWKRTRSIKLHAVYWAMNILFHFEVDKRLGIPIGKNLDEAKK